MLNRLPAILSSRRAAFIAVALISLAMACQGWAVGMDAIAAASR